MFTLYHTQDSSQQYESRDSWIRFVFLGIILSEIRESKLSFCQNFCLQENHEVSVYTSSSTTSLDVTPKSVELHTIFWHLDSILPPNTKMGEFSAIFSTPQPLQLLSKCSRITSEEITRILTRLLLISVFSSIHRYIYLLNIFVNRSHYCKL